MIDLKVATAHLIVFKQRKKMMAGGKPVLTDFGTLRYLVIIGPAPVQPPMTVAP